MNIPHILYLSISFIFVPILAFSQARKDEVVEKKRYYITKSGQKTLIVNDVQGLDSPNAEFLKKENYQFKDDMGGKYKYLNQAARDVDRISKELKEYQDLYKEESSTTSALSFEQSEYRLEQLRQQRTGGASSNTSQSISQKDIMKSEKMFLEDKFDGKPSFFINSEPVSFEVASKLTNRDIIKRFFKVDNTQTGNPNGEIWYTVNTKTLVRLGLTEAEGYDESVEISSKASKKASKQQKENEAILEKQKDEVEALRRELEQIRNNQTQTSSPLPSNSTAIAYNTFNSNNNSSKVVHEEVVGFKDSPLEKAKRERDLEEQKKQLEEMIANDEPVRSVKRIKERERSR